MFGMKPDPAGPVIGQILEHPNGIGRAKVVALSPDEVILQLQTWDGDSFTLTVPRSHWHEYTRGAKRK